MERHIPYIYIKKWFFWPSKLCCPLRVQGKKTFWSTLNVMILQTVRNEYVRFGGHVEEEEEEEEECLRYIPVKGITLQFSTSSGS
jgi:hypothetical protein